jgi:hypothetical protein
MGEDREDRQGVDAGLTRAPAERVFEAEVSAATKYERGLVVKAAIALVIVGLVILMRLYFYG